MGLSEPKLKLELELELNFSTPSTREIVFVTLMRVDCLLLVGCKLETDAFLFCLFGGTGFNTWPVVLSNVIFCNGTVDVDVALLAEAVAIDLAEEVCAYLCNIKNAGL